MGRAERHQRRRAEKRQQWAAKLWPFGPKMSEVDQEEQAAETSLKAKWGRAGENLEASDHSLKEEGRLQQQEKMKEYDRLLNRAILITACLIVLALVIAFLV